MISQRPLRFFANGLVATAVHFSVLWTCMEVFAFQSGGMANLTASVFGIAASFTGNRYFAFSEFSDRPIAAQFLKFLGAYAAIAAVHGTILFLWTDVFKLDYRAGFAIAVILQFLLGYLAGKKVIFT